MVLAAQIKKQAKPYVCPYVIMYAPMYVRVCMYALLVNVRRVGRISIKPEGRGFE
jgi:hypothetical protein